MKRCRDCRKRKPESEFHWANKEKTRRQGHCKICNRKRVKRWRAANHERQKELQRDANRRRLVRLRAEAIDAYGGQCKCCGEEDARFLTIEHLDGLADADRILTGKRAGRRKPTLAIIARLKREGWPDDCTVLCFNCNCAKSVYGVCPHEG